MKFSLRLFTIITLVLISGIVFFFHCDDDDDNDVTPTSTATGTTTGTSTGTTTGTATGTTTGTSTGTATGGIPCSPGGPTITEDFETNPPVNATLLISNSACTEDLGWQYQFGGNAGVSAGCSGSSTGWVGHNDDSCSAGLCDSWIILGPYCVSSPDHDELDWFEWVYWGTYAEVTEVAVSTTGGNPNTDVFTNVYETPHANTSDWVTGITVDLSTYNGQQIWVAFHYRGNGDDSEWFIDDITLE